MSKHINETALGRDHFISFATVFTSWVTGAFYSWQVQDHYVQAYQRNRLRSGSFHLIRYRIHELGHRGILFLVQVHDQSVQADQQNGFKSGSSHTLSYSRAGSQEHFILGRCMIDLSKPIGRTALSRDHLIPYPIHELGHRSILFLAGAWSICPSWPERNHTRSRPSWRTRRAWWCCTWPSRRSTRPAASLTWTAGRTTRRGARTSPSSSPSPRRPRRSRRSAGSRSSCIGPSGSRRPISAAWATRSPCSSWTISGSWPTRATRRSTRPGTRFTSCEYHTAASNTDVVSYVQYLKAVWRLDIWTSGLR